jgi:hypothetical protein
MKKCEKWQALPQCAAFMWWLDSHVKAFVECGGWIAKRLQLTVVAG